MCPRVTYPDLVELGPFSAKEGAEALRQFQKLFPRILRLPDGACLDFLVLRLRGSRTPVDPPQKSANTTRRSKGRRCVSWSQLHVEFGQFPVNRKAGIKTPFGEIVVDVPGGGERIFVKLTPYRFVIFFALIRKLLKSKGIPGQDIPLGDAACVTAEVISAFILFSEVYETESTIPFSPSDLSGTLLDIRKDLASRGLKDLLRGDLRKGLWMAVHPDNITLEIDQRLQNSIQKDNLHENSIGCQGNTNNHRCRTM